MKSTVKAHQIVRALSKRHCDELFLTEVKTGPSSMSETLRFDGLSIKKSWTKPCFTGYEVKVSRNDFLHDDKFIHYRDYCHRLYLVCPKDLIKLEELPEDIGLIYYNPEKETLNTKRVARLREIEIPSSLLYYILMSRLDSEKHPFFSNDREYIEEYLEDKKDRYDLGYRFKSKMAEDVSKAAEDVRSIKLELESYKKRAEERDEIVSLMKERGLISWDYHIVERLKEALESEYPVELCNVITRIADEIQKAKKMVGVN